MGSESSKNEIISSVKKLASIATVYIERLEGFSSNLPSPATWSDNLEYIAQFIEHASKMNQKYLLDAERTRQEFRLLQASTCEHRVTAEAITPKARGGCDSMLATNFASQHSEMLEDLRNMKNVIANAMSSPKLTPTKSDRHEESNVLQNYESGEDLYYDLTRAHEQLESLSVKIESYQDDQRQWEEREAYFHSRIVELEEENHIMKATPPGPLASDQAKMKEAGALIVYNFQQRHHRAATQRAFQTWSSQSRMTKHLSIAKEMAKELVNTRKKILLLKSHLDESM